jgi:hypothetical protein
MNRRKRERDEIPEKVMARNRNIPRENITVEATVIDRPRENITVKATMLPNENIPIERQIVYRESKFFIECRDISTDFAKCEICEFRFKCGTS